FLYATFKSRVSFLIKEFGMCNQTAMVIHHGDEVNFFAFARIFWIRNITPVIRIGLPAIISGIMLKMPKRFLHFSANIFRAPALLLKESRNRSRSKDTWLCHFL